MTLSELAKMRKIRAVPAYPIVLTADADVHLFCVENSLPVIWTPAFSDDEDLRPLHGLPLWIVATPKEIQDRIKEVEPKAIWSCISRFGFQNKVNETVGREVIAWN